MKKNAQVLLLTMLLLALASIMVIGLAGMWKAEVGVTSYSKNGIIALYLAQAGLERAKIALKYNWSLASLTGNIGSGNYKVNIILLGPDLRSISSTGSIGGSVKVVQAQIKRTGVTPFYTYNQIQGSWKEI
jgi:hypothetical protein